MEIEKYLSAIKKRCSRRKYIDKLVSRRVRGGVLHVLVAGAPTAVWKPQQQSDRRGQRSHGDNGESGDKARRDDAHARKRGH